MAVMLMFIFPGPNNNLLREMFVYCENVEFLYTLDTFLVDSFKNEFEFVKKDPFINLNIIGDQQKLKSKILY